MTRSRPGRFSHSLADALSLTALLGVVAIAVTFAPDPPPVIVILGSLKLHVGLAVLALAIVLALLGHWLRALIYVALVMAGLAQTAFALAPSRAATAPAGTETLTVVSFNVLGKNWQGAPAIVDYLVSTKPDVVFMQEAWNMREHLDALTAVFPYRIGCPGPKRYCGTVIWSRYPLSAADYYQPGAREQRRFFVTSIQVDGRTVSLAMIHLTKAELGPAQGEELAAAAREIAALPEPVIVAGDFNTAPWAPRFVDFLNAAGLKRPVIEPATWPGDLGWIGGLGLPIDHILVRGAAFARIGNLPSNFGSNHRGLIARLAFPPPQ